MFPSFLIVVKEKILQIVKKFDYLTYVFFSYLWVLLGASLFFGAFIFVEWVVIILSYFILSRYSSSKYLTWFLFLQIGSSFLMLSSVLFFYWLDPTSYLLIQKHSLFGPLIGIFEFPPSFSVGENDVPRPDPLYNLLDRQTQNANTSRVTYVGAVFFSSFWNATVLGGSVAASGLCFKIAAKIPNLAAKSAAYGVSGIVAIGGVVYGGLTENPYNGLVKDSRDELTLDLANRRLTELQILQRETLVNPSTQISEQIPLFAPKKTWSEFFFKKEEVLKLPEKKKDITDFLVKATKDDLAPIPKPKGGIDPTSKGVLDLNSWGDFDASFFDLLEHVLRLLDFILSFFQ
jgi:hypothetical protein